MQQDYGIDFYPQGAYIVARMSTKSYKDTIFLPDTTFPMRGDLTTKEPARLEKWENDKAKKIINARFGRVKILAGGKMTKALVVEADKFAPDAIKAIVAAGGTVKKYI